MQNEKSFGCCEVSPSLLLEGDIEFKIPHPDPVWVVRDSEENLSFASPEGLLCVFSNEEKAMKLMEYDSEDSYVIRSYGWSEVVDNFGGLFANALIDPTGEQGLFRVVPLQKGP
jgi:hypothetical protein